MTSQPTECIDFVQVWLILLAGSAWWLGKFEFMAQLAQYKIWAFGLSSARAISDLSFWAQLGSGKSSFEPLWLGSAWSKIVGSTIPAWNPAYYQHWAIYLKPCILSALSYLLETLHIIRFELPSWNPAYYRHWARDRSSTLCQGPYEIVLQSFKFQFFKFSSTIFQFFKLDSPIFQVFIPNIKFFLSN
jgi:hypothetical protein